MSNFIKRNLPIFIIGLVTLALFIFIIVLAQKNNLVGPELVAIDRAELITENTPTLGNAQAKVTLVEFSDFQCPACKSFQPALKQVLAKYSGQILFGYKHFPLPQHNNALNAAKASIAAKNQGQFWEYSDKLFENQNSLEVENLIKYAEELNMDKGKFESDMNSDQTTSIIQSDIDLAKRLGVNSTPTFYINGKQIRMTSMQTLENEVIKALGTEYPDSTNNTQESTESTSSVNDGVSVPAIGETIIEYSDQGFSPNNIKIEPSRLITWVNKTDKTIKLQQIIKSYEELTLPIEIEPNKSFSLKMTHQNLWTYKEADHKHYGSIFVLAQDN